VSDQVVIYSADIKDKPQFELVHGNKRVIKAMEDQINAQLNLMPE
jgi:hypothetical protein